MSTGGASDGGENLLAVLLFNELEKEINKKEWVNQPLLAQKLLKRYIELCRLYPRHAHMINDTQFLSTMNTHLTDGDTDNWQADGSGPIVGPSNRPDGTMRGDGLRQTRLDEYVTPKNGAAQLTLDRPHQRKRRHDMIDKHFKIIRTGVTRVKKFRITGQRYELQFKNMENIQVQPM